MPFSFLSASAGNAVNVCYCVSSSDLSDALLPMQPSDVLDMPVDPNEPTYCLCHQVSYGEMIGCDNPDVSVCPKRLFQRSYYCCCKLLKALEIHLAIHSFSFQCPIEWFHFACVDLATKPKGKW